MTDKKMWLQQEPPPEEIRKNADGAEYIPIGIVENLLDELTDGEWDVQNFKYSTCQYGTTLLISASAELNLNYDIQAGEPGFTHRDSKERHLTGAITFPDHKYGSNLDFAAIALSECIKNAAKKLGPRFGKNLNGRGDELSSQPDAGLSEKPRMDIITRKKYENAVKDLDTKTMNEIENYYLID